MKFSLSNAKKSVEALKILAVQNSPSLLTGVACAGVVTTTILAVKATPTALELLEQEREIKRNETHHWDNQLTPFEVFRATYKCYVPAVVTGGLTISCIIGANSINLKRNAALAAAYSMSDTLLKEYQEKVKEVIGEKKQAKMHDSIREDRLNDDPIRDNTVIFGEGLHLCYDTISGRYFKSHIEKIRRMENELNQRLMTEMHMSLNDLYYELDLPNVKLGDDLGWNVDQGLIRIDFSSHLAANGEPCLAIDYDVTPKSQYWG